MKSIRSRGFTLIELLVVIAIIGLLASIILASLNTARQKGRDSRRLADLKEIANALELANNGTAVGTMTCAGTLPVAVSTCSAPTSLASYTDPSVAAGAAACTKTATGPCNYAVYLTTDTQHYEICAYLETQSGPLTTAGGMVNIQGSNSGNITAGCP